MLQYFTAVAENESHKSTRDDHQSSKKNPHNNQRPTCGKDLSSLTPIAKRV